MIGRSGGAVCPRGRNRNQRPTKAPQHRRVELTAIQANTEGAEFGAESHARDTEPLGGRLLIAAEMFEQGFQYDPIDSIVQFAVGAGRQSSVMTSSVVRTMANRRHSPTCEYRRASRADAVAQTLRS